MKIKFIVIAAIVSVAGVILLFFPKLSPAFEKQDHLIKEEIIADRDIPAPAIEQDQIESLNPWNQGQKRSKIIPQNMRGVTDDPYVVELLATFKKVEIGKVVATENGTQQLWAGGSLLFEAKRIGSRSRTTDGVIALDAVTGKQPPIEDAEVSVTGKGARLISSPREIWIITTSGNKTKVSPPNVDAFAPVISPGGRNIAFTGRILNKNGFPSGQQLYVGDLDSGNYRVFSGDHLHHYQVWAIDWVENGTVLRVFQDHGETGGHMKLMKVRVE